MSLTPKCCSCLVCCSDALALQAFSYLKNPIRASRVGEEAGGGWGRESGKKERRIKLKHSCQCSISPPEKSLLCTEYHKCVFYWGEGEGTIRNSVTLYHCEKKWWVFLKAAISGWSNFSLLFRILYVVQDARRKKGQATFLHTVMWRSRICGGLSLTIGSPKMPPVSSPLSIGLRLCQIIQKHLLRSSSFMHVQGETHYYWLPQPFRLSLQGLGNPQTYSIEKAAGKSWVWKGYSGFDFLPPKSKTRLYSISF